MRKVNKKFFVILVTFVIFVAVILVIPRNLLVFEYFNASNESDASTIKKDKDYDNIKALEQEKFLVIYDKDDEMSLETKENTERVLDYIKKPFKTIEKAEVVQDLDEYRGILITFEGLDHFSWLNKVDAYVKEGGNLALIQRPYICDEIEPYKELFGVKEYIDLTETAGIELISNVLINGKGIENKSASNSSLDAVLEKYTIVHATTTEVESGEEKEIPMIWENEYGKGEVLVFNGQMLYTKGERGLLTGVISLMNNEFIYPIVNTNVMFIDDFPCPLPDTSIPQIMEEYNKDFEDFFVDVWWPDMISFAKRYNLLYTGYYIENYEDDVEGLEDYKINKLMFRNIVTYGRELLKINGEIGMHGFNHQPLAFGDYDQSLKLEYETWPTEKDMITGLKIAENNLKDVFPNYELTSYVAPSNVLSPEGRAVLKKAIPTLKTISTIYYGPEDEACIQEFEVGEDGIIDFPRISYGYFYTDDVYYQILSGVTSHGIISHFIHGDDILDEERSFGEKWSTIYKSFDKLLSKVDKSSGWVEKDTATDGAMKLKNTLETDVVFKYEKDSIIGSCSNFVSEGDYILRCERPIKNTKGCTATEIDKNIYLVKNMSEKFTIELGE